MAIAHSYIAWARSLPFDIGLTVQTGIQLYASCMDPFHGEISDEKAIAAVLEQGRQAVHEINFTSSSNGSLMRIHPLAILKAFLRKYKIEDSIKMEDLIRAEISITHSN